MLVKQFGWSLEEIENADMESLLRFINHYPSWDKGEGQPAGGRRQLFADQVNL